LLLLYHLRKGLFQQLWVFHWKADVRRHYLMQNAGILCIIAVFFAYKFYQYRKAIWNSMNFYGNYFANVMKQKEDEIKKKNERR